MKPFYVTLKPFIDHQTLLRPTAWPAIFNNHQPLDVEIGFGNGEYLAKLKQNNPTVNYVGFEEYCERIAKTLRKLSRVEGDNARVLRLDVRPGFKYLFAPRTIRQMYCLFPPPWPKKGDIKHRLFTPEFLKLANNRLEDGGSLKIVTDAFAYADWIEEQIPGTGFAYTRRRIAAVHDTKFERKWVEGGQGEFAEILLIKEQHIDLIVNQEVVLNHYKIYQFNPDTFLMKDYSDGAIAVAFKEILFDPKRQTALVYVLVHDENLLQNVRIVIAKEGDFWRVYLAQGSLLMPTPGIAKAIECVRDAAIDSLPLVGRAREGYGMNNFRRFCAVLLIIALMVPSDAFARRHHKRPQRALGVPTAVSALLIDSTANQFLYSKNIDRQVYPASTTKVLTALLALGKLSLDDYVTVNASALNVQETKLGMRAGEQFRVSDLVYAALLKSANDAANVLAEAVAGSQKDFVVMMNARAASMGATHTKFANAHGLPSQQEQYTTARDMMLIFKEALKNPFFKKVISFKYRILYSKEGRRFFLKSHNKALFLNWKKDIDGKTGYTQQAQSCFVGYFSKQEHVYIVAVFGCRKRWEDIKFIVEKYGKFDL